MTRKEGRTSNLDLVCHPNALLRIPDLHRRLRAPSPSKSVLLSACSWMVLSVTLIPPIWGKLNAAFHRPPETSHISQFESVFRKFDTNLAILHNAISPKERGWPPVRTPSTPEAICPAFPLFLMNLRSPSVHQIQRPPAENSKFLDAAPSKYL